MKCKIKDPITGLEQKIYTLLDLHGYVTIDQFMKIALSDPEHGYYTSQSHVLGTKGDFITSPEISQFFGEMVGMWLADQWFNISSPTTKFHIVELGGGRGVLMDDVLRSIKHVPNLHELVTVHSVEISDNLASMQKNVVEKYGIQYQRHYNLQSLPNAGNMYFIANEFFDALPIKQYVKRGNLWYERCVIADNGDLRFNDDLLADYYNDQGGVPNNSIVECSDLSCYYVRQLSHIIARQGGAALLIDYGYNRAIRPADYSSTLQAVRNHKYSGLLENIGKSDITAHVNFEDLYDSISNIDNIQTIPMKTQRSFLLDMGIDFRLQHLQAKYRDSSALSRLQGEYKRLILDMGDLYKVMSFRSGVISPLSLY